jgi:hypothetical protein
MMMATSDTLTLRHALIDYLEERLSLADFVAAHAQAIHQASVGDDAAALDLALDIELRLAEYQNGDWRDDEFRAMLRAMRSTYIIPATTDVFLESGVTATLIRVPVTVVSASSDRSLGTARA